MPSEDCPCSNCEYTRMPTMIVATLRVGWENGIHVQGTKSLRRNKDLDRRGLRTLATHCQEQTIKFRRKETSPCSFHRDYACRLLIVICVVLLKNANFAIAPTGVNSFSGFIVENVVAITYSRKFLNDIACLGVEDEQARRHTGHDEQPVLAFIERHRIVGERQIRLPGCDDCVLLSINDSDFSRLWEIYVDSRTVFLKLK